MPISSKTSPTISLTLTILPCKVSAADVACPANNSPITSTALPAFIASGLKSLICGTNSPSSPASPLNVLAVFLTADSSVIPVAADKSSATGIILLI